MGARSLRGDSHEASLLGIANVHAYSVLAALEVDGVKLIQLRNPWGGGLEWKGNWSDDSTKWTGKRKHIVAEYMKRQARKQKEIHDKVLARGKEKLSVVQKSLEDLENPQADTGLDKKANAFATIKQLKTAG